ncbi:unnamed protein product [marine sediment metagenome]|uniref:Uncharacterized protein n=1 Tax=marine sediment metagenome TaxID=412755 RepID=X1MFU6_9ZZZZ
MPTLPGLYLPDEKETTLYNSLNISGAGEAVRTLAKKVVRA